MQLKVLSKHPQVLAESICIEHTAAGSTSIVLNWFLKIPEYDF